MKEAKWENLANFIQIVLSMELPPGGIILFRGQPISAPLLPRLVREAPLVDVTETERTMLSELRRQGTLISEIDQPTDLELLTLAQHYGMATRLLDWSSNPLVALWFSCSNYTITSSSYIYVYRVYPENIENAKSPIDPFSLPMTRVLQPTLNNPRLAAQGGWFTIHPCMFGAMGYTSLDQDPLHLLSIYHFEIPGEQKRAILDSLDLLGINSRTLFPGVDGLTKHINWQHARNLPGLARVF